MKFTYYSFVPSLVHGLCICSEVQEKHEHSVRYTQIHVTEGFAKQSQKKVTRASIGPLVDANSMKNLAIFCLLKYNLYDSILSMLKCC